jgi:hypothetical protein
MGLLSLTRIRGSWFTCNLAVIGDDGKTNGIDNIPILTEFVLKSMKV